MVKRTTEAKFAQEIRGMDYLTARDIKILRQYRRLPVTDPFSRSTVQTGAIKVLAKIRRHQSGQ